MDFVAITDVPDKIGFLGDIEKSKTNEVCS